MHDRGTDLDRGGAQKHELYRVLPGFDAAYSGYGQIGFSNFRIIGHRAEQMQSDGFDCRSGITTVAALAANVRFQLERIEIDPHDTVDGID